MELDKIIAAVGDISPKVEKAQSDLDNEKKVLDESKNVSFIHVSLNTFFEALVQLYKSVNGNFDLRHADDVVKNAYTKAATKVHEISKGLFTDFDSRETAIMQNQQSFLNTQGDLGTMITEMGKLKIYLDEIGRALPAQIEQAQKDFDSAQTRFNAADSHLRALTDRIRHAEEIVYRPQIMCATGKEMNRGNLYDMQLAMEADAGKAQLSTVSKELTDARTNLDSVTLKKNTVDNNLTTVNGLQTKIQLQKGIADQCLAENNIEQAILVSLKSAVGQWTTITAYLASAGERLPDDFTTTSVTETVLGMLIHVVNKNTADEVIWFVDNVSPYVGPLQLKFDEIKNQALKSKTLA